MLCINNRMKSKNHVPVAKFLVTTLLLVLEGYTTTCFSIPTTSSTRSRSPQLLLFSSYLKDIDSSPTPPKRNGNVKKVTTIKQPEDLLNFVLEDERLGVVKVWAKWCLTCKRFDSRWRKLMDSHGDKVDAMDDVIDRGRVRFAEMEYSQNEEMCRYYNVKKLPYILIYKGKKGKVADFQCNPSSFKMLIDAVELYADPPEEEEEDLLLSDQTVQKLTLVQEIFDYIEHEEQQQLQHQQQTEVEVVEKVTNKRFEDTNDVKSYPVTTPTLTNNQDIDPITATASTTSSTSQPLFDNRNSNIYKDQKEQQQQQQVGIVASYETDDENGEYDNIQMRDELFTQLLEELDFFKQSLNDNEKNSAFVSDDGDEEKKTH